MGQRSHQSRPLLSQSFEGENSFSSLYFEILTHLTMPDDRFARYSFGVYFPGKWFNSSTEILDGNIFEH